MTEPGEKTTVFSLFGSESSIDHNWMIVQINLTSTLGESAAVPTQCKELESFFH